MKQLMRMIGTIAFWLSWPFSYVYLRQAERTRILVVTGDKVLLVQTWHGPGAWSLPGGGVRRNEDNAAAASRELMEETSVALGVDQLRPLGVKVHTEYKLKFTCHYFVVKLAQPITPQAHLPEILEAQWVPIKELTRYRLGSDARYALSAYGALVQ